MSLISRGLLVLATAGALTFPNVAPKAVSTAGGAARQRIVLPAGPPGPNLSRFTPDQLEAYISSDGIAYIRPGLKIKLNSVTIGSDRKPVVDLNLTDTLDQPLDRLGKVTPGPVAVSFVIAWYDPVTRNYNLVHHADRDRSTREPASRRKGNPGYRRLKRELDRS